MDAFTLTQYLHDHIPLSKAMQVGVLNLNEDSVVLGAPLALVSTRKVLMKFEWVTETGEASKAHSPMSYRPLGRNPFEIQERHKKGGKEATSADSVLAARGLPCAAQLVRRGR